MKTKLYMALILGLVIVTSGIYGLNYNSQNKDLEVYYSEEYLGEQALIEKSDLVIVGSITNLLEKKTGEFKAKSKNEASIVVPYSVYNMQVVTDIAGNAPSKVNIVFTGNKPKDISLNKEYVFFLEKDMLGGNNYHLTSYVEGLLDINGEQLSNNKSGYSAKKYELIDKVKKIKN